MKLSDEQLKELRRLGAAMRKIDHTCLIMEIDEEEFRVELKNKKSPAYRAYFGGREETMTKVMEEVIAMASRGSASAQEQVIKFYKDTEFDEV